jgi:transglutaminase-like putative cysteine protease
MMMKYLCIFSCFIFLFSCSPQHSNKITIKQIDKEQCAGNFTRATELIDLYIVQDSLTEGEIYDLNWRKDLMHRIAIDFSSDKKSVVEYISKYYPDVNDEMLAAWEADKSLESMVIDGQKRYFNRGAANLFRINKQARERKLQVDKSPIVEGTDKTLISHLPEVVSSLKHTGKTQDKPVSMKVSYAVTLKPDVVPDGEAVRCWLPYPRGDHRRQTDVKLLSVNDSNYTISPDSYAHKTLYMEKVAKKGEPLTFSIEFSYSSAAEWFSLEEKSISLYNTESELYKTYTAERFPHIVFSDSIKAISDRIIGGETNPYQKVKRIFTWINQNFPWAGAREYSTIPDIPAYVLENKHGDCGQVTLLFITLARYNGIPARWQSGFMMHPGGLNLHDWGEYFCEGIGWIPVDQSFGIKDYGDNDIKYLFSNGIDAYRWIVNSDYSRPLYPAKIYPRSETVDFQRGELEWKGGNIYFDKWTWDIDVDYQ